MDKHRKDEEEALAGLESRYDEALLSANWNPVIDLLGASCGRTKEEATREATRGAFEEDPDGFLKRIYVSGS